MNENVLGLLIEFPSTDSHHVQIPTCSNTKKYSLSIPPQLIFLSLQLRYNNLLKLLKIVKYC